MQYTGLKDKNGVEIYEGDILKYNFEDDTHDYMPVFFKDGSFMTGKKDEEYLFDDLDPKHGFRIEVAGNILRTRSPFRIMKPITYKISRGYDDSTISSQVEVEGVLLFELYGYQWAAHQEKEDDVDGEIFFHWIVSEVSTGFELESGKFFEDKDDAKKWARNYLFEKGEAMTKFHVEKARMKLQEYGTKIEQ